MREIAKIDGRPVYRCAVDEEAFAVEYDDNKMHVHSIDERREVFERDCRMQSERYYGIIRPVSTREACGKNLNERLSIWSMVRRCNGME